MTLAFLGWVDAARLAPTAQTVCKIAAANKPFALRLDKISAFPNERRPRVMWVGTRKPHSNYRALSAAVRATFGELRFEFKTDAVRTLRFAASKPSMHRFQASRTSAPSRYAVREIALFQSLQTARTTRYEILERAALGYQDL